MVSSFIRMENGLRELYLIGFYSISTIVDYLMPNPINKLRRHFVDNILKQAWALFCTQLNSFNNCNTSHLYRNCSIWLIDRTQSGATTQGQSGPGSNGNERVLHIPHKSPKLKHHYQRVYCHIQNNRWECLTPLQRFRCILQPLSREVKIIYNYMISSIQEYF